jgi:hypothetical protein
LHQQRPRSNLLCMTERVFSVALRFPIVRGALLLVPLLTPPGPLMADPGPAADSVFNAYITALESRLARQHASPNAFLPPLTSIPRAEMRLRKGDLIIEQLTPSSAADLPGAMLHHWRGTAFAPGAKAADFERLMKNFNAYPQRFSPHVIQARVLSQSTDRGNDRFRAFMRVSQSHVISVVMDTTYDVSFGRLDPQHGYSIARSIRISEIDSPGTASERALNSSEEHGFLWRLNTYWSYEERDGGLYMQIETVSLARSIPQGLGWAVRPYVESVPRESLESTLRLTCNALQR